MHNAFDFAISHFCRRDLHRLQPPNDRDIGMNSSRFLCYQERSLEGLAKVWACVIFFSPLLGCRGGLPLHRLGQEDSDSSFRIITDRRQEGNRLVIYRGRQKEGGGMVFASWARGLVAALSGNHPR